MSATLIAIKQPVADQLVNQAIRAHPFSRTHRAKWIRAVRYLRKRDLWILDKRIARTTKAAA